MDWLVDSINWHTAPTGLNKVIPYLQPIPAARVFENVDTFRNLAEIGAQHNQNSRL